MMKGDEKVLESGGQGQYRYKDSWKPTKVDRILNDGDTVTLGDATLTAVLTPGHTRGCTTWTMKAKDKGKTYNVVIVGSPNVNPGFELVNNKEYPTMAADYAHTFKVLKALPADIFLGAHGDYYGMAAKVARMKDGGENPFIDPAGYKTYVADREKAYLTNLESQRK
jgi:metallo-beta-lactamase class B